MVGWVGGLWYDKQVTSSSAKSLSVRTSVTIIDEISDTKMLSTLNLKIQNLSKKDDINGLLRKVPHVSRFQRQIHVVTIKAKGIWPFNIIFSGSLKKNQKT